VALRNLIEGCCCIEIEYLVKKFTRASGNVFRIGVINDRNHDGFLD